MNAPRCLLIVALSLSGPAVATTIIPTFPVELSARDRERLVAEACRVPHGADANSVSAWSYEENGRVQGADVACATSRYISGIAMHFPARCFKERRRWTCSTNGLATYLPSAKSQLQFNLNDVDAAVAVEMVDAIVRQGGFDDVDLRLAVEGSCSIRKLDVDSWELTCTYARLMVTRDHLPHGAHRFRVFLADYDF